MDEIFLMRPNLGVRIQSVRVTVSRSLLYFGGLNIKILINWQSDKQIDKEVDKQIDKQANKQIDRQRDLNYVRMHETCELLLKMRKLWTHLQPW